MIWQFGSGHCTIEAGRRYSFIRTIRAKPKYIIMGERGWEDCKLRTGKEIRFRFGSSEDKAGKEAKCRPTGW